MTYTTHGLMTAADLADHQKLTDTGIHPDCPGHLTENGYYVRSICSAADDCPGEPQDRITRTGEPLDVYARLDNYQRQRGGGRITSRQHRRMVKKAARDPQWSITRTGGMGFPPGMQGYKQVTGSLYASLAGKAAPVSGGPV